MAFATVSAGHIETPYLRAGDGPPVIVLGVDAGEMGSRLPAPLAALAARCRVILPDLGRRRVAAPQSGPIPFESWLRDFMDGLGLEGVRVVAAAAFEPGLARFAATTPGRIERMVIFENSAGQRSPVPPPTVGPPDVWRAAPGVDWTDIADFAAGRLPAGLRRPD